MEMFLMVFALSLFGVLVSGVLFSVASRGAEHESGVAQRAPSPALAASAFFIDAATTPPVPIEALLLQINQHVRLEQAAAEAFLHAPTRQALHCRTMSPLVH